MIHVHTCPIGTCLLVSAIQRYTGGSLLKMKSRPLASSVHRTCVSCTGLAAPSRLQRRQTQMAACRDSPSLVSVRGEKPLMRGFITWQVGIWACAEHRCPLHFTSRPWSCVPMAAALLEAGVSGPTGVHPQAHRKPDSAKTLHFNHTWSAFGSSHQIYQRQCHIPHDLFIFSLTRFHHQTLVVHLVNVSSSLHVGQDVVLEIRNRVQGVWRVLVLLYVSDDLCSLCTLGKVDEVGLLNNRGDTILDKSKIGQVYT